MGLYEYVTTLIKKIEDRANNDRTLLTNIGQCVTWNKSPLIWLTFMVNYPWP